MPGCSPRGGREHPAAPQQGRAGPRWQPSRPCPSPPGPGHPSSSKTSSGMEHGQSVARAEGLAAQRTGSQGQPWRRAARAARPQGLRQGTPLGALVPQEHPQPKPQGHPTRWTQVRKRVEAPGRGCWPRNRAATSRLASAEGQEPERPPQAPQSQITPALNTGERPCFSRGKARETATARRPSAGASGNSTASA